VPETLPAGGTSTTGPDPVPATTTTTPTTTSATTPTTTAAGDPQVAAFPMPGGTVVVRYTTEWIELVSATPDQGYGVDVESGGPDRVEVEFEGPAGDTTFQAELRDGELVTEIDTGD